MTKSNIVEKIDNIITKIEENSSKELSEKEIRNLLNEIDDELVEIEEKSEGKQKELVSKKVEELREELDKINKKWKWGRIKDILEEDIKGGLVKLENEIKKLEQKVKEKEEEKKLKKEDIDELKEWREFFPRKTAKEVSDELKFITEQSLKFLEKLEEVSESSNTAEDVSKISQEARKMAEEYVSKIGQSAIPVIGPLVGSFYGAYHGTWMAGIYTFDKATGHWIKVAKEGMVYVDKAREDAKDFAENMVKIGAEGFENFRKGGENFAGKIADNAKELIEKNLNVAEKAVEGGIGVKAGIFEAGIGVGRNVAKEVESEMLRKELEEKKQELERSRIKHEQELKNERDKVAQELKEKTAEIERLQKQLEKQSDKTQDNLLNVIEIMAKGSSRSSSPTPPPAYNKQ